MILKDPKYSNRVPNDYYVVLIYRKGNVVHVVNGVTYHNKVYSLDKKFGEVKCTRIPSDGAVITINQDDPAYNKSIHIYLAEVARDFNLAFRLKQFLLRKLLFSR